MAVAYEKNASGWNENVERIQATSGSRDTATMKGRSRNLESNVEASARCSSPERPVGDAAPDQDRGRRVPVKFVTIASIQMLPDCNLKSARE